MLCKMNQVEILKFLEPVRWSEW